MKVNAPSLNPVLRSDTQGKLLAAILFDPGRELTLSELAERAGTSAPTALREIDRAEAAGLVITRRLGRNRLVRANGVHPLYRSFREVIVGTYGVPVVVTEELADVGGLKELYLFGSWAARYLGETGPAPNDIDILVVGTNVDRDAVYAAAERIEDRVGIPVQVAIRTENEWAYGHDPFLTEVRRRPLINLGDGRE